MSDPILGEVRAFAFEKLPDVIKRAGWAVADGAALNRKDYPTLFSVIGTLWGSPDPVNSFTADELRRKIISAAPPFATFDERRIVICEKMRPRFIAIDLENEFAVTMDQMRHCKIIRDQYAHEWFSWGAFSMGWGPGPHPRKVTLKLVSLEDAVKGPGGINASPKNLPLPLLEAQAVYFANAQEWIMWLQAEFETASGKPPSPPPIQPELLAKPDPWQRA